MPTPTPSEVLIVNCNVPRVNSNDPADVGAADVVAGVKLQKIADVAAKYKIPAACGATPNGEPVLLQVDGGTIDSVVQAAQPSIPVTNSKGAAVYNSSTGQPLLRVDSVAENNAILLAQAQISTQFSQNSMAGKIADITGIQTAIPVKITPPRGRY